jgi:hypothetical protein
MCKTLEEIGYEKRDNEYYTVFHRGGEQIAFDKLMREIIGERFIEDGDYAPKYITMEELKAIYKYCEDNKWI